MFDTRIRITSGDTCLSIDSTNALYSLYNHFCISFKVVQFYLYHSLNYPALCFLFLSALISERGIIISAFQGWSNNEFLKIYVECLASCLKQVINKGSSFLLLLFTRRLQLSKHIWPKIHHHYQILTECLSYAKAFYQAQGLLMYFHME